jgi:hexosaminidase
MMHFVLLAALSALPVVPAPMQTTTIPGTYTLPQTVTIAASSADERNVAGFAEQFLRARGVGVRLVSAGTQADIAVSAAAHDAALGDEGYLLTVEGKGITIAANGGPGLFYGLQTLEQLFGQTGNTIGEVSITDRPAFAWRGMMLDVSRHFYTASQVERFIDLAAHYKFNTFHWHLSDDQGWRVEIKRYPRLTSFASCRSGTERDHDPLDIAPGRYCGFYTQDQIRQVVAYAKKRYVTIVPEIDMPGHSTAAIAAYPWLGCTGKKLAVSTRWGGSYPICPTDRAIAFEEGVLTELMQLFPGPYIHTGGDEVPFDAWQQSTFVHGLMQREHLKTYPQVQAYFERRIEQFIESKGRRMVGWDEILDGGISRNAVVMSWRGVQGGIEAAKLGNDAVMTPDGPLYFDAYQGDRNDEPEAIGGLTTLQMVYNYDPLAGLTTPQQRAHILGTQGNIWTEWIGNEPYLYYMALPRELALSEIAWSEPAQRGWDSFEQRMGPQYLWLQQQGYNFRIPNPSFAIDGGSLQFANVSSSVRTVTAETDSASPAISVNDPVPNARISCNGKTYSAPLQLQLAPGERTDLQCVAILPDGRKSTPSELILTRRQ